MLSFARHATGRPSCVLIGARESEYVEVGRNMVILAHVVLIPRNE